MPNPEVGFFYSRLYNLEELNVMGFSASAPTRFGALAVAYHQFGSSDYREQQIFLSQGVQLREQFYAGYSVKGLALKIQEYGSAYTLALDVSMLAKVSEKISFGFALKNINQPGIGQSHEQVPSSWTAGSSLKVFKTVGLSLDYEQNHQSDSFLKSGLEWSLVPFFILRGGMQTNPSQVCGGFGLKVKSVFLDYSYRSQESLPGSHLISTRFMFGKGNE